MPLRMRHLLMCVGMIGPVLATTPVWSNDEDASRAQVPSLPNLQALQWPALLSGDDVHPALIDVRTLLERGDLAAARQLAIAHARAAENAPVSDQLDARLAVATVLAMGDESRAAVKLFDTVADKALETQGFMAPHLLPARAGAGLVAAHRGDVLGAQTALAEALHLHRIHHGLHDAEQTRYLRTLAELAGGSGAAEEATLLFKRSIHVLHRQLDDLEGAPDSAWYRTLDDLLDRLRVSPALGSLALPLGSFAERMEAQPGVHGDSLVDLQIVSQAADLLSNQESRRTIPWNPRRLRSVQAALMGAPAPHSERQAHQLIEVGHVWWLAGDGRQAMRSFRAAAESGHASVARRLSEAEALIWPADAPRPMTDTDASGSVEVVFSLDESGRLTRIRDLTVFPEGNDIGQARAAALRRALARAVFRPSLVQDRRPSSWRHVTLHDRYRPSS